MANLVFEYYGLGCFKITAKFDVGEVTLFTDPLPPGAGLKMPRGAAADIVVVSSAEGRKTAAELVGNNPFIVSHPGEYEVKGVFIYGLPVGATSEKSAKNGGARTLYRIEAADLSLAYLGGASAAPSDATIDELTDIDILILPVGGQGTTLTAAEAAEVMTRLEPRIVVPMYYKLPGLDPTLDSVEKFVKEAGLAPERVAKLKLGKKDLPAEETKLFILTL
ncbi:hypothetical protein EPN90_04580 [Patescibacteria group bacterium]|nr:MAG: hypothetical protein EPN90_04580 [Patescibacteria group bacterium]